MKMNKKIKIYLVTCLLLAIITLLILFEANTIWKRILEPEPTEPAATSVPTATVLEPLVPAASTITSPSTTITPLPTPQPTPTSTPTPKLTPKPTKKPTTPPTQSPIITEAPTAAPENTSGYVYNLTESEKIMFATLIKLEAGDQSWECQLAVGSVVLNRLDRHWGGKTTLKGIIYAKGQFSPAHRIPYTKPTQMQLEVVEYLCKNGVVDNEIVFFYYKRYSKWGTPAYRIGTEYFSKS